MTGRLYVEKGGMWEEVSEEELREIDRPNVCPAGGKIV